MTDLTKSLLAQEFTAKVFEFLKSPVAQTQIKKAIQQNDIGLFSRLFNDMQGFTTNAINEEFNLLLNAKQAQQMNHHLIDVMRQMSEEMIDLDGKQLSKQTQHVIGIDQYKELVTLCDGDTTKLANYFLQAQAVLYTMLITNQNDANVGVAIINTPDGGLSRVNAQTHGSLTEEQHEQIKLFGINIWQPISNFTHTHLSIDTLNCHTLITENDISNELKQTYLEWIDMISNILNDIDQFKELCPLTDEQKNTVQKIIKTFSSNLDRLDTYKCKFESNIPMEAQQCEADFDKSVSELSDAVEKLPDLFQRYAKKSWYDKFWDLVSLITNRDFKTQTSKQAETSAKLSEFTTTVAEKVRSRQSSKASTPTQSAEDEDNQYDNNLSNRFS